MSKIKDMKKKLFYDSENYWEKNSKTEHEKALKFSDDYINYLNNAKTERETIKFVENELINRNFTPLSKKDKKNKKFEISRNKNAAIAFIGKKPIADGVNLIVSHIDSPRVDLKQRPIYEDSSLKIGIMRTHYYGGIKKYQWLSTPLALHGVVLKKDGEKVDITIGEKEDEPVFVMPDLLPHLARKAQYSKKIGEAVAAGHMNVIFNSIPYPGKKEDKDRVKLNALHLLNKKYDITEKDLLSAELQFVPAGHARHSGLDKSMVLGYGQDDRICAYTSLMALFDLEEQPEKTSIVYLADKEEVGSDGNTGAKSNFIVDFLAELLKYNNEKFDSYSLRKALRKTQILSADVNAAINPNYPNVHEKTNAVHIGFGVSLTKFTGAGGKGGTNDANAEFMNKISGIFNEEDICWQIGELGKVDEGGGGTIAKFMAEHGAEVIDCGPGVLGMHSLYELTSKADIYSTYKAYNAFYKRG